MKIIRDRVKNILSQRVFIGDGAIGTLLQKRGLKPGMAPEMMLLENPHEVSAVHQLYVDAGADMVTTNSFGASRPKLAQHGLADKLVEINRSAVEVARKAAGDRAFVAASIGPTGELMKPMGSMTMPDLVAIYREQVQPLRDAGADFAILETMGDIGELQAAARACFLENLPFIASMTYDETGRSLAGSSPEIVAITLEPYEPLAICTNCGLGPVEMLDRVKELVAATHLPVMAQPNAGLPELIDGETVFRLQPDAFADEARALVQAGAAMVGGCCGTTPEHIVALRHQLQGMSATERHPEQAVRFASRSGVARAGQGLPFCVIGERINPTGRRKLTRLLKECDFSQVRKDASAQVSRGANILDINMGVPDTNEPELMVEAINVVQSIVPGTPLCIDSNDPDTLIRGLREVVGRPLLNSINGETHRMEKLLPVVRETGANFIALAMDETGIPEDADARMKIIRRIVESARKHGISSNRILVDCLVFTVGSQPHQAIETLAAVQRVITELGCGTILGVSNVSFGLPRRAVTSSTFLAMAIQSGLAAGIINPLSDRMMETLMASELLLNRDPGARKYVNLMKSIEEKESNRAASRTTIPVTKKSENKQTDAVVAADQGGKSAVYNCVMEGDRETIVNNIESLLNGPTTPQQILSDHLVPAIETIGRKYGLGQIYLPQLIMAGEAMREGVAYLQPRLAASSDGGLHDTPVVIGTVKGDIHDIGKNIVSIVLANHGFRVIDLGKDVDSDAFVKAIQENNAPVAALSALMTTTMPAMEETVQTLHRQCPLVKVMIGGAVVNKAFADRIGADGYTPEAVSAGDLARVLAGLGSIAGEQQNQ